MSIEESRQKEKLNFLSQFQKKLQLIFTQIKNINNKVFILKKQKQTSADVQRIKELKKHMEHM